MEDTMGMLDDVLGSSVPKGSLAKPLMIAFSALLASGALHKQFASSAPSAPHEPSTSAASGDGGLLAGLGGLLGRLQQSGQSDAVNSWVGPGQNQPISSSQLGAALGPAMITALAAKSGLSEQELTSQLSQLLPGVVDRLTPNGRLPSPTEAAQ
jgi:uncharacterized protein YidB (DUF937 family)